MVKARADASKNRAYTHRAIKNCRLLAKKKLLSVLKTMKIFIDQGGNIPDPWIDRIKSTGSLIFYFSLKNHRLWRW